MGSECLLLLEDDPQLRRLMARLLARDGLSVIAADCVAAAEEIFASLPVGVLVTDLGVPGDVREMVLSAQQRDGALQVIVVTGQLPDEAARRLVPAHLLTVLGKPVTSDAISAAVDIALALRARLLRHAS